METCEICGNEKNACTCHTAEPPAENPAPNPSETCAAGTEPAAPPATEAAPAADAFAWIGAAFTAEWPEPQAHFVQQVKEESAARADAETAAEHGGDFRFLRDSNGHYFDPKFCDGRIDPKTGIPKKSVKGLWLLKRGASRDKLKKNPPQEPTQGDTLAAGLDAERAALEEVRKRADANATATAQALDLVAWIGIEALTGIGADAQTQNQGTIALKGYLLTLEKPPTLPAWAVPLIIYGKALKDRMMSEKAKPRRQAIKEKLVILWYRLTRKERPKPAAEGRAPA